MQPDIPDVPTSLADVLAARPEPQRRFRWNSPPWRDSLNDSPAVLARVDSLPPSIDRNMVREIVTTDLAGQAVLPAFVTAMIWGYGDESYGPTRVRWVLGDASARGAPVRPDVPGLLESAARIVHHDGPVEGFRRMNNAGRIKHLGSALFHQVALLRLRNHQR
jgi:hypothetical protein